ncbi:carboxylesterase family protein [Epilithonimonas sp. JDS]|uniref:alpha/beta hydrolase n=1 Tax=Epilithonimonas sp. JDS TaxID=2902797 RepID=UPI001E2A7ECF|nr:alpha/beta hydrolase [Epilithonimonas sp. JDS]MCD9854258.1 carboxylesterase family protein [Epilithonimonas sp. JDS]
MQKSIITFLILALMTISCRPTRIYKDISYTKNHKGEDVKLNIFTPKNIKDKNLPVLIFVYGGNWNTGNKNKYNLLGRNFARKNMVVVIPDYTLSPNADVNEMTKEIAAAIQFTKANAKNYHGNPERIFISGHSAGGQLSTSAVMNPKYGIPEKTILGIILIDGAGIDMKNYLEKYPPTAEDNYDITWSKDPEKWKQASSIYFINEKTPPFLIYVGEKTYPSIKVANDNFLKALKPFQPNVKPILLNKKHVPMVLQYFLPWSKRFDEAVNFMESVK